MQQHAAEKQTTCDFEDSESIFQQSGGDIKASTKTGLNLGDGYRNHRLSTCSLQLKNGKA